ncbi:MAG: high light inducible protein [Kamptonema sp. SIO4C4]|nr:high light inducible protein [Kamptonema sp. SIO4C4]
MTSQEPTETTNSPNPDTETEAETEPTPETPSFGFNQYAEKINGRFAMIGFLILILLEIITHQDLFTWLGLR